MSLWFDRGLVSTYTQPVMYRLSVAAGLLCLSSSGLVFAQGESEQSTAPKKEEAPKSDVATPGGKGKVGSAQSVVPGLAKMSGEQKKKQATQKLDAQRQALAKGTELLSDARGRKDIIQLNCINEKLTQVKGLLRVSERAHVSMLDAMAADRKAAGDHEFARIWVADKKTAALRSEMEACVGEQATYSGQTEVEVDIDPDIAGTDIGGPAGATGAPPPGPANPPPASTF